MDTKEGLLELESDEANSKVPREEREREEGRKRLRLAPGRESTLGPPS